MANFDWGYMAGSGDWAGVTTIDPSWMTTIDQNQQKGINATDGSTHAPTDPITIGGAGMAITGQLTASSITYAAFVSGVEFAAASFVEFNNDVDFKTGSDAVFESGSSLLVSNGATVAFQNATNPLFAGDITLANYPILASKTVYKRGLNLISTTNVDGSIDGSVTSPVDAAAQRHSRLYSGVQYPTIMARRMSGSQSRFWLEVPGLIQGATLTQVKLVTSGIGTTPTVTFPQYTVQRYTMASAGTWPPATVDLCSLATLDAHQVAGDWGNIVRTTTVTCYQNNVVDEELYSYAIECTTPDSSSATTILNVQAVIATYTVTSLRP